MPGHELFDCMVKTDGQFLNFTALLHFRVRQNASYFLEIAYRIIEEAIWRTSDGESFSNLLKLKFRISACAFVSSFFKIHRTILKNIVLKAQYKICFNDLTSENLGAHNTCKYRLQKLLAYIILNLAVVIILRANL